MLGSRATGRADLWSSDEEVGLIPGGIVSGVTAAPWFALPWAPYALLDPRLCFVEVNAAFQLATHQPRERLLGAHAFDAFPENPADPHAAGAGSVGRSMEHVLRTGTRDWMDLLRYDVPHPLRDGTFLPRIWMPVNMPIRERGRVVGILHHVQNLTPHHGLGTGGPDGGYEVAAMQSAVDALLRQFPRVDPRTALGVLTDSQRIVTQVTHAADAGKAAELARLRLEIHTRRPALPAE